MTSSSGHKFRYYQPHKGPGIAAPVKKYVSLAGWLIDTILGCPSCSPCFSLPWPISSVWGQSRSHVVQWKETLRAWTYRKSLLERCVQHRGAVAGSLKVTSGDSNQLLFFGWGIQIQDDPAPYARPGGVSPSYECEAGSMINASSGHILVDLKKEVPSGKHTKNYGKSQF